MAEIRESVRLPVRVGAHETSANVHFWVDDGAHVEINVEGPRQFRGVGLDLFEALRVARLELEGAGIELACNGARRDVYPSPMLRQATAGRRAYVLAERGAERPPTVDIFGVADWGDIGTVAEQGEEFDRWVGPQPPSLGGAAPSRHEG